MSAISLAICELNRFSRRERSHWLRSLYLASLATAVAFSWLAECSAAKLWTEQEGVGLALFRRFAILQFVLLNLAVILDLCLTLGEEKRNAILDLLLASPLSAFQIAFAKFLAAVLPAALLLISGLPIFFTLLLFGGLSANRVALAFSLTLSSACLSAAVAMATATAARRTATSIVATAAIIGLYVAIGSWFSRGNAGWLFANPYMEFARLWADDNQSMTHTRMAPLSCLVAGMLVLLLAFAATVFMRRNLRSNRCELPTEPTAGQRLSRALARQAALAAGANVILWRDGGWFSAFRHGIYLSLWLILILCLWLAYLLHGRPETMAPEILRSVGGMWPVLSLVSLMPLLAAASRAFAMERAQKTLDLLLTAPGCEGEILSGKMQAVFFRFGPILIVPALCAAFLAWQGVLPPYSSLITALAIVMGGVFLAYCAVFASMFVRPFYAIWLSFGAMFAAGSVAWICAIGIAFLGGQISPGRVFLPYWLFGYGIDLGAYVEAPERLLADFGLCVAWHVLVALALLRYMRKRLAFLLRRAMG